MEAMDIFLATTKELSHLVLHHPLYSALGSVVCFALLLRFYCRLTLGECDCDQDMTGKTVVITGATSGIGRETARDLARRNARLVLCCRNLGRAQAVSRDIQLATGNDRVVLRHLDLCSFESVRRCAREIADTEERVDVLINNAGMTGVPHQVTEDGCEIVMQANHLGHFLFTFLLIDLLKKGSPSRVVNVASAAYKMASLDVDDLANSKGLSPLTVYSNSKLANILFTTELANRLAGTGVTVNALHPGVVKTNIMNDDKSAFSWIIKFVFLLAGKSSLEGAQTSIHLAVSPDLEKTTGRYFSDCKEEHLKDVARNRALGQRLFEASEKIVGVTYPKRT